MLGHPWASGGTTRALSVEGAPVKSGASLVLHSSDRCVGCWFVDGVKVQRPQRMRGRTTLRPAANQHRMKRREESAHRQLLMEREEGVHPLAPSLI